MDFKNSLGRGLRIQINVFCDFLHKLKATFNLKIFYFAITERSSFFEQISHINF